MFDHVTIGAIDYKASKAFFVAALEPLGVRVISEGEPTYGVELGGDGEPSFCIAQTSEPPSRIHIAFSAKSRAQVDAFYHAAILAGGLDNGPPGIWERYSPSYYAAFVIAPGGHNIEAVFHEDRA